MKNTRKPSALIIGASSGLGRAIAYEVAQRGWSVVLCARDARDLEALTADLHHRFGVAASSLPVNLTASNSTLEEFVHAAHDSLSQRPHIFLVAGHASDSDTAETLKSSEIDTLMSSNFLGFAKFLTGFLQVRSGGTIEQRQSSVADGDTNNDGHKNGGSVTFISSIAAPVPRGRNVVYAAAKNALESLCFSLQHRYADTPWRFCLCRLGYVDTAMSFGQRLVFPVLSSGKAATIIVNKSIKGRRLCYVPGFWAAIILILRSLPWSIYKRLRF